MKYYILIFLLVFCKISFCQETDSTDAFKLLPWEHVKISSGNIQGNSLIENSLDSFERSSFLMSDKELQNSLLTVRLIEYKNGEKVKEKYELLREKFSANSNKNANDNSATFSLSRKPIENDKFLWVFETSSTTSYDSVEISNLDLYRVCGILYVQERNVDNKQIITQKIPIGKPFIFLAISTWDNEKNFPGLWESRQVDKIYDWNKMFNLGHTFLIELEIDKPDNGQTTSL